MPMTVHGKAVALEALAKRRANPPEHVDNSKLYAGSPMYYYCKACSGLAAVLAEGHISAPPALCDECRALKDLGWLE